MKTYLVTGAAGFIGSNFVHYILRKYNNNINIIILDALTYAGNLSSIKTAVDRANVKFVKGDIGDKDLVNKLFAENDVDYIVNFAAESHVDRSITNPRLFLETNILGTQNLLDCARQAWLLNKDENGKFNYKDGKKYLQISTDEVYGSLSKDYIEAQELKVSEAVAKVVEGRKEMKTYGNKYFHEFDNLAPHSPYSASKASADFIVQAYHDTYGVPVNITRCSNNYGPYQFPEKLIPLIIKNILEGKRLPVYGKGENVRDWLYVDDHCKAIDLVLNNGKIGEVYNIGGFNEESNINIVKTIIRITAKLLQENEQYRKYLLCPIENVTESMIDFVADRPGHDMRYAIDPTKIATELGWYPETPFTKGIELTIKWYLDNQKWVEDVTSGNYQQYYEQMYTNRK